MINPSHLRPGNWIHRKGSSAYGIVNGKLLALLEEDEKERERFEYIELSGELLEAAGFEYVYGQIDFHKYKNIFLYWDGKTLSANFGHIERLDVEISYIHQLQNLIFVFTGSELPLPESAKIINQAVEK